jgi:hypothetical protein
MQEVQPVAFSFPETHGPLEEFYHWGLETTDHEGVAHEEELFWNPSIA